MAHYVVENYLDAAFLTAERLAEAAGVSESSVIRLAQTLGYDGYPAFQADLQEVLREDLTQIDRFRSALEEEQADGRIHARIIRQEIENLNALLREVTDEDVDRALRLLSTRGEVCVIGIRQSAALADYFVYNLRKARSGVTGLTDGGSTTLDHLATMAEGSLVVAIDFRRYARALMSFVREAKTLGHNVLAITDSYSAPLVGHADHVLVVPVRLRSYIDSFAAPMALINGLVSAFSTAFEQEVYGRLTRLERTYARNDVHTKEDKDPSEEPFAWMTPDDDARGTSAGREAP